MSFEYRKILLIVSILENTARINVHFNSLWFILITPWGISRNYTGWLKNLVKACPNSDSETTMNRRNQFRFRLSRLAELGQWNYHPKVTCRHLKFHYENPISPLVIQNKILHLSKESQPRNITMLGSDQSPDLNISETRRLKSISRAPLTAKQPSAPGGPFALPATR